MTNATLTDRLTQFVAEEGALARLARTQGNMSVPMTRAERDELRAVRDAIRQVLREGLAK
jgi:hypothetical protein